MPAGSDYVSERLTSRHRLEQFDSGQPELDRWLRESAAHADANNTGRTFVWHAGDQVVVAYYTLAGTLIARQELPRKVGRGSPDVIPAVLLARLALDRSLHGQGLGGELLWDALSRVAQANLLVATRFVVVDAIDASASGFYQRFGFTPVTDHPPHRLVQKTSDVLAALGTHWPS